MNRRARVLPVACLLICCCTAFACPTPMAVESLSERVVLPEIWSAQFRQSNHLKVLSAPLRSEGQVFVDDARGLVWRVLTPIRSDLVITSAGIDQGGGVVPATQLVGKLLRDLVAGDLEPLTERFHVSVCAIEDGWTATLEPQDAYLAERISAFRLEGSDVVASIQFEQLNGNDTRIEFARPEALSTLPEDVVELLLD